MQRKRTATATDPAPVVTTDSWLKSVPLRFRTGSLVLVSLVLLVLLWHFFPGSFFRAVAKPIYITMGATLAYLVDRVLFPESRPLSFADPTLRIHAEYRRAALACVCIYVMGLAA